MPSKIKYQPLRYSVGSGQQITIDAETDKLFSRVTGIHANLGDPDAKLGSTLSLEINSKEIFPSGFEVVMITTGDDLSPNDRYHDLDEPAGGTKIKGTYTDSGNASGYPYSLVIYLKLETP